MCEQPVATCANCGEPATDVLVWEESASTTMVYDVNEHGDPTHLRDQSEPEESGSGEFYCTHCGTNADPDLTRGAPACECEECEAERVASGEPRLNDELVDGVNVLSRTAYLPNPGAFQRPEDAPPEVQALWSRASIHYIAIPEQRARELAEHYPDDALARWGVQWAPCHGDRATVVKVTRAHPCPELLTNVLPDLPEPEKEIETR